MDKFNSCLVVFIRVDKVWVLVSGMFLEQTLWKGIGIGEEEETFLGLLCLLGAGSLGEREEILSVAFDGLSLKGVFLGSSFFVNGTSFFFCRSSFFVDGTKFFI